MASPYTLQESLHPALGALGAYTSNLAQYRGQMTPYRRDPRLDNQRAFGDALTAYMQATPQRERMRLEREQLAETQRRQRILDQRAKTKFDQEQKLYPLQTQLAQFQLEAQEAERKKKQLELKRAQGNQKFIDNWETTVREAFPDNPTAQKAYLRMGPSKDSLEKLRAQVALGVWEPVKMPKQLQALKGLVTRNSVTGEIRSPNADFMNAVLDRGYKKVTTNEQKKLYVDVPESVVEAGLTDKWLSEHTVYVSDDPDKKPEIFKAQVDDIMSKSNRIQSLVRGQRDRSYRNNPAYVGAYNEQFVGDDLVTLVDQNGQNFTKRMPKPLPPDKLFPTPDVYLGRREKIEKIWSEYEGNVKIPDSVKAKQIDILATADFLKDKIKKIRSSLKEYGTEQIGRESFNQRSLYGNIFSALQRLKELGVPTGRDIELVEQEFGNPSEYNLSDFFKSGGQRWIAYLKQLEVMEQSVDGKVAYANKLLGMGVPLDLGKVMSNNMESKPDDAKYESGDFSAEEFENAVKIK